ncbi:MAG: MraY family glycosyltransferase [Chloroflexota bacterium]
MTFIEGAAGQVPLLLVVALAAGAISFLLTPIVRDRAVGSGQVDRPNHRRVNLSPVPRGGGIAIAAGFLIVATGLFVADQVLRIIPLTFPLGSGQLVALLGGGAAAAALGALDDRYDLRARWQLLGQVGLALGAVWLGIGVAGINNPFGQGRIPFDELFAAGFTVLWIVGMINSINFIDGLDGLSTGIAIIAAFTLGAISLTTQIGQPLIAVLCFTLAGSLAGFLRWNFNPASIFTGTAGVTFVGYTLAILAILGVAKIAVAVLVLGVPIIDTFWIIVRRMLAGRSPFTPDRGHLHHRLLDLGLSHRQTVLLIYGICAALGVLSFVLSGANQVYAFLGVLLGTGVLLFAFTRGGSAAEAAGALASDTYEVAEGDDALHDHR